MIGESLLQGLWAACREGPKIPGSEETKRAEQERFNVSKSLLVHASNDLNSFSQTALSEGFTGSQ